MPVKSSDNAATIHLGCRKSNLVKRPYPKEITFTFSEAGVAIKVQETGAGVIILDEPKAEQPTVKDRIHQVLREKGTVTKAQLQEQLSEVRANTLTQTLKRDFIVDEKTGVISTPQQPPRVT